MLAMQTLYRLPDSLWEKISATIEPKRRCRKTPLQVIVSGIVYLLNNGCKWRDLPPQYGNYKLVWYYFNRWTLYGVLDEVLYLLSAEVRRKQGRSEAPTRAIIDAQSVKTPAGTGDEVGYDANKKVKGRKRHLAVDSEGNVLAAGVTSALVADKTGARVLKDDVEDRTTITQVVADRIYRGEPPFTAGGRIRWQIVERVNKEGFSVLPVRWIVERTFAWLTNYRRLVKDYEKTVVMARAVILMAAIHITLKKLTT